MDIKPKEPKSSGTNEGLYDKPKKRKQSGTNKKSKKAKHSDRQLPAREEGVLANFVSTSPQSDPNFGNFAEKVPAREFQLWLEEELQRLMNLGVISINIPINTLIHDHMALPANHGSNGHFDSPINELGSKVVVDQRMEHSTAVSDQEMNGQDDCEQLRQRVVDNHALGKEDQSFNVFPLDNFDAILRGTEISPLPKENEQGTLNLCHHNDFLTYYYQNF